MSIRPPGAGNWVIEWHRLLRWQEASKRAEIDSATDRADPDWHHNLKQELARYAAALSKRPTSFHVGNGGQELKSKTR